MIRVRIESSPDLRIQQQTHNRRYTIMATTWDLFHSLGGQQKDFDRFFSDSGISRLFSPMTRSRFLPGLGARRYPLVNVREDESGVYVDALAPGVAPESLDVKILGHQLHISGLKTSSTEKVKPEALHRSERSAGRFTRSFTLPAEVNQDKIKAEYKYGILSLVMPKAEVAKPRQITVNVKGT
jgi:HSP20 family protein